MWEGKDRRRAPRIKTRFGAVYSFEREEGEGFLASVSYFGALLENASVRPQLGTPVRVHVLLPNRDRAFELVGDVVLHTKRGFAIVYEERNEDLRRFIDDIAAIVGTNA